MNKQIMAAEISHESAPSYICQMLTGREEALVSAIRKSRFPFEEIFILSSTGKFVVYGVGPSIDPLLNFFLQDPRLFNYVQFYKSTEATVNHIFAMAAGLFSVQKGEHGITEVFRRSIEVNRNSGTSGLVLGQLVNEALRVGIRVRMETGIDTFGVSVVDNAIELLYRELPGLFEKRFLVMGTGRIAELTIEALTREGMRNIVVSGEDVNQAHILAKRYSVTPAPAIRNLESIMAADVIFAAGDGVQQFSSATLAEQLVSCASGKVFIDLTSPGTFPLAIRSLRNKSLFVLDDLKRLQAHPLDVFGGLPEAWRIIADEAMIFRRYFEQLQLAPVLIARWRNLFWRNKATTVSPGGCLVAEGCKSNGKKPERIIVDDKLVSSMQDFPALVCVKGKEAANDIRAVAGENLLADIDERSN